MIGDEIDFEPPHGLDVFDVTYDGVMLSFITETGREVTMRGEMKLFSIAVSDRESVPDRVSGIFTGAYEADDFSYPVEVHFTDTQGVMYERPRLLPECILPIDASVSYLVLADPIGTKIVCVRDPGAPWQPEIGKTVGRIGHLLFRL